MSSRAAFLLGLFLAALPVAGAEGTGAPTSEPRPRGAAGAEAERPARATSPRDPGRKRDVDEEVIAHLEELERLELLQHLELFDTVPTRQRGR